MSSPVKAMLRAANKAAMNEAFIIYGLLVPQIDRHGAHVYRPALGITISPEVVAWRVKPTYDADGVELTPGTRDPRYHCDLLIGRPALDVLRPDGSNAVLAVLDLWRENGLAAAGPNRAETGIVFDGVEMIDPSTVATPSHGFAGVAW